LAAEEESARRNLQCRVPFQLEVKRDDVQNVQMLALVFMDSLHLRIEQRRGIDKLADMLMNVVGKAHLCGMLCLSPICAEFRIAGARLQVAEELEIANPMTPDAGCDQCG